MLMSIGSVSRMFPDLDCIFLNAGTQRPYDFSKPEQIDLTEFNDEIKVNFLSFIALTHAFLPFLQRKASKTSLILYVNKLSSITMVSD